MTCIRKWKCFPNLQKFQPDSHHPADSNLENNKKSLQGVPLTFPEDQHLYCKLCRAEAAILCGLQFFNFKLIMF